MRWSLLRNKEKIIYLHSFFYKEAHVCDIVCVSAVPVNIVEHTDWKKFVWETYQCKNIIIFVAINFLNK